MTLISAHLFGGPYDGGRWSLMEWQKELIVPISEPSTWLEEETPGALVKVKYGVYRLDDITKRYEWIAPK